MAALFALVQRVDRPVRRSGDGCNPAGNFGPIPQPYNYGPINN